MGQTLTHGIYLPDEGERNCYNGLASNWSILDGAVGTIAEHTSALAGKAPLVHTHGKADITDLFNSANTWSGDNSYSKAITVAKNSDTNFFFNAKHTAAELGSLPSSDQALTLAFKDKNNDSLCYARVYYETTGGNSFRIFVRNKYASGAPSTSGTADYAYFGLKINADKSKEGVLRGTFRPYDNNTYDLGSSSYQWNNLYAKKVNTQSVNGINPGALSFPKIGTTENVDFINVLGNIDVSVTSAQTFVASVTGWFCISFKYDKVTSCRISASNLRGDCVPIGSDGYVGCYIPVTAGVTVTVRVNATAIYNARIYLCQGNV